MKKTQTPPEVTALRERIKKFHKNGKLGPNLITTLADESKMAISLISQFKDGKRGLSIERFFQLEKIIDGLEKIHGLKE